VAVWLLVPTIQWYGFTDPRQKELLKLSQDQLDTQPPEIKKQVVELKKIRKGALNLGLDLQGGANITLAVNEDDLRKQLLEKYDFDEAKVSNNMTAEYASSVDRALEVLKNRMDQFGVSEPTIRKTFDAKISIELPGLDNPQLVKEALSKVGKLEFHIVDEKTMEVLSASNVNMSKGYVVSRQEVPASFEIPEDSDWYPYYENDEFGTPKLVGWYVLKKNVELDGRQVKNARSDQDQYGKPRISFELTSEGADIFGEVTAKNIKKRLAIVLDGKVKSAPVIQGEISGGQGEITGDFTMDETVFLANVLKAGSLPVKLDVAEEKVIGPTLGADSIKQGATAMLVGTGIVVIFMMLYYRTSGFISVIALAFNILYLLALLAGVKATLTMSGIAGIALAVGMTVDANVIIYERIREELRRSRTYKHALDNGFEGAFNTIIDSHVTTLIAGFSLYIFGAGSIKGFGITLVFGLLANLFTALFLTHLIFDWMLESWKLKHVSI
jgi:preprotein translocase subunit SecD